VTDDLRAILAATMLAERERLVACVSKSTHHGHLDTDELAVRMRYADAYGDLPDLVCPNGHRVYLDDHDDAGRCERCDERANRTPVAVTLVEP
jgi:hypothetical protein